MPVSVVGADTALGAAVLEAVLAPAREVRAFVSNRDVAPTLRSRGIKVAVGDVSDGSHVAAVCWGAHTVILITDAAFDDRELAFVNDPAGLVPVWVEAARGARRVVWVGKHLGSLPPASIEVRDDGRSLAEIASYVAALDEAG